MSWALKRQLFYLAVLALFFAIIGFWIGYPYFNKPPTCYDGKQNGTETGIDCGLGCPLACKVDTDKISILWSRVFEVVPGRYNAVAYIENHNPNMAVDKISYRFRFADENNIFLAKREGQFFIPPAGKYAIFEPAVDLGNSIPVYTTFEFLEDPVWVNVPPEKVQQLKIFVEEVVVDESGEFPKINASLRNNSFFEIPDVTTVAILYDEKGNVINTSKTYLERLKGEEKTSIVFTWLSPFTSPIFRREIIPMFNIFSAQIK